MKLPNTPISAGLHGGLVPMSAEQSVASAMPAQATPAPPLPDVDHVDYNLHPLKVAGLDHYIEQPAGGERFRIS